MSLFVYGFNIILGFIDGTRNPDHLLRAIVDQTIVSLSLLTSKYCLIAEIFPDDNEAVDAAHTGGSYLYAGRFEHDLKTFNKMDVGEKSEVIGMISC